MPIQSSEIIWKKPDEDSDTTTNGGRITAVASPSDTANNDFPDVSQAELTSGLTRYRKRFVKVANDADLVAQQMRLYIRTHTAAAEAVTFFPGAQRDTQNDITGAERQYGAGQLAADVAAAAIVITVNTEGAALDYFKDGDTIMISDKTSVFDTGNNREEAVISGAPSYAGDQATITLTAGLKNGYLAADTVVASIYSAGDVKALADNYSVSSAAGTYDDAGNPVIVDHIGSVEQTWTATFTSATAFDVVGDTVGSVGSGAVSGDFAPTNADEGKPYFTIPSAGWGGTWAVGETFTFQTHPCAVPVWYKHTIPPGCAAFSANKAWTGVMLQSA
ncbi:MAG: hypothetical protein OEZ04_02945 [Nitrospinota bacterium]|nr:hypothetical protein [Nitrospinota bacterium]